jgi:hypothetical protein
LTLLVEVAARHLVLPALQQDVETVSRRDASSGGHSTLR